MKTQQFDLYAAEREVNVGRTYDLVQIQVLLDDLRETPWWTERFAKVRRVEAGPARLGGRDGSVGWFEEAMGAGRIELAPAHRNELSICHELAHVLAQAVHGSKSHDPYFARTYLELVYFVMGAAAFQALYHAFESHGIDHDPVIERRS